VQDIRTFGEGLVKGFTSFGEGLGFAAAHQLAGSGLAGPELEAHAHDVDRVLQATVAALSLPEVREAAADYAIERAKERPGLVAGRVIGRQGAVVALGFVLRHPIVTLGASVLAMQGSSIALAQKGALELEVVEGFFLGH